MPTPGTLLLASRKSQYEAEIGPRREFDPDAPIEKGKLLRMSISEMKDCEDVPTPTEFTLSVSGVYPDVNVGFSAVAPGGGSSWATGRGVSVSKPGGDDGVITATYASDMVKPWAPSTLAGSTQPIQVGGFYRISGAFYYPSTDHGVYVPSPDGSMYSQFNIPPGVYDSIYEWQYDEHDAMMLGIAGQIAEIIQNNTKQQARIRAWESQWLK